MECQTVYAEDPKLEGVAAIAESRTIYFLCLL